MRKMQVILVLLVITFSACKKKSFIGTDYNFPFDAQIELESTLLKDNEYSLTINVINTGNIQNPDNNYTVSYSGNSVLIKNQANIISSNIDIPFTSENIPVLLITSQQLGTQSIQLTIKNNKGYSITKTVTFTTVESSLNVTTSNKILNTFTDTEVSFNFTVAQDIPSALSIKFENVNNAVTIKLNGQVVSRTSTLNINANAQQILTFSYSTVADYNPKIIISDANSQYPIELSISVMARNLSFNNLVLQRRTNPNQNIFFDVTNTEEFVSSYVYNFKADINSPSQGFKVNIQSTRNVIKEIHYNGTVYYTGDFIPITNASEFSKILIYFRNTDFGETTIRVKLTDDWNTTSNELSTSFVLYDKVKINSNTLVLNNVPNKILKSIDVSNNGSLQTNALRIESLGNPITSINYNINGKTYMSNTNSITAMLYYTLNSNGNFDVNNSIYDFVYTYKIGHSQNLTYIIPSFTKFINSSLTINRTYGSPVVLTLN